MRNSSVRDQKPITLWLSRCPSVVFVAYAGCAAFATYFSMYAFRKPYQAASYPGLGMWGLDLKTVLVLSQSVGYLLSKYAGIKVCSELRRTHRLLVLLLLVGIAQTALLLFAVLPLKFKILAIFINGLPLGMVWGICVLYLEGRRDTEYLFAGLSCSYIIASGVVKDVGRALMSSFSVSEFWMPFVTGGCFLPAFCLAAWMLDQLPDPTPEDRQNRAYRQPMEKTERRTFLRFFSVGIVLQLILYIMLTAFRDFRDIYGAEIFRDMGLGAEPAIFSRCETWVAFAALLVLVSLRLFDSKRWGVIPNIVYMLGGSLLLAGSTWLYRSNTIITSDLAWMILVGIGGYVVYVTNDTIFYERVIANSNWVGTAAFMAYVMDAAGYTGSLALQIFKATEYRGLNHLEFLQQTCYIFAGIGILILCFNIVYFPVKTRQHRAEGKDAVTEKL